MDIDPNTPQSRNQETFGILNKGISYFTSNVHQSIKGAGELSGGGGSQDESKSPNGGGGPNLNLSLGDLNLGGGSGRGDGPRNNNQGGDIGGNSQGSGGQSTTK